MKDAARNEERILTVPNLVTLVRLACVPLFVVLLTRPDRAGWYPAALLLGGLGATDWVDGFAARHLGQVSTLGKVLDPVADRVLLGVAIVATIAVGAVPLWLAVAVLVREAVVASGFLYVAIAGGRRMDVQWAGKAGTLGLMFALPLFLAGHANDDWRSVAEALAWVFAIPGLALGWYAGVTYLPRARRVLEESRQRRNGLRDKEAAA